MEDLKFKRTKVQVKGHSSLSEGIRYLALASKRVIDALTTSALLNVQTGVAN